MNQDLTASTGGFIAQLESPQTQQGLKQYFKSDDLRNLFNQVMKRAVQEQPELLNADRTSLFLACQTAAQDGLLPDRKDGALVVYNTKVGEQWIKKVQWQPMIGGLRKTLANHGFTGLRAELVYENDVKEGRFSYEKGDNPKIIHNPNVFGDRGAIVGAYAIVTDSNTGEVYRDSMSVEELEVTRSKSKNPQGGAWKDYTNEMYRKTMARRLFKQLPLISTELLSMIERDDERNYNFNDSPKVSSVAKSVQQEMRKPIEGTVEKPKPKKKKVVKKAPEPEPEPEPEQPPLSDYDDDPLA